MLTTISYAFLISLGLLVGLSKLKEAFKWRKEGNQNNSKSSSMETLIVSIMILAIIIGSLCAEALQTLITLNYYTYPRFSPTPLPSDYKSLINELYSLKIIYGNVMWIPTSVTYAWKTDIPRQIGALTYILIAPRLSIFTHIFCLQKAHIWASF